MSVRDHAQVCCDAVRCVEMPSSLDRPALAGQGAGVEEEGVAYSVLQVVQVAVVKLL